MVVKITISSVGASSGPYNLFSDATGFAAAFETNISKASLIAGFTSYNVPDGTTIIRVSSLAPCNNYVDTPVAITTAATWYSMQERPEFAIIVMLPAPNNCFAVDGGYSFITLTVSSIVINGVEKITGTPYTKTITPESLNIIPANNTVALTCAINSPIGYTYTNFVDLLNEAFADLGLTKYTAQISLINKPGPFILDPEEGPQGFYIIRPIGDVFSIKTKSDRLDEISWIKYTNNNLTNWDGGHVNYKGVTESGINLVNGVVIEP